MLNVGPRMTQVIHQVKQCRRIVLSRLSTHRAGAHPCFCSMKWTALRNLILHFLVYCRILTHQKLYSFSPGSCEAIGVNFQMCRRLGSNPSVRRPKLYYYVNKEMVIKSDILILSVVQKSEGALDRGEMRLITLC